MTLVQRIQRLERCETLLRAALVHQVANLGKKGWEFYTCYTYPTGKMPPWVTQAKRVLRIKRIPAAIREKR